MAGAMRAWAIVQDVKRAHARYLREKEQEQMRKAEQNSILLVLFLAVLVCGLFLLAAVRAFGATPQSAWEKSLLRAASHPDPTFRAARCGRFLLWELEHAGRGRFLQLHAADIGCSEIELPAAYRRELTPNGYTIWRRARFPKTERLMATLIADAPQRPRVGITVLDRRPGWKTQTRVDGGAQIIDVVIPRQGERP